MLNSRMFKDTYAERTMLILTVLSGSVVFLMGVGLYLKSRPILSAGTLSSLFFSEVWAPLKGEFGFYPFISGTLWVTVAALIIAMPLSMLTSIYLSEFSSRRMRALMNPLIDLLAGIPSVIYGMWGVIFVVPLVRDYIAPFFGVRTSGYCVLSGGIVLAIMILPVIIHVSTGVFGSIPYQLREASLALGATKWQTVKHVVLRRGMPGVIAAFVLGLSRAFGETMAVLMVVGNVAKVPSSVFDPAYPLPALIANNYGEMLSVPLYDSAMLMGSLILLTVVLFFNIISRVVLRRVERRIK